MSKRMAEEPQGGVAKRKRDSKDALSSVLDHADELINCLQSLKRYRDQLQHRGSSPEVSQVQDQLSELSKELLPSFSSLASSRVNDGGYDQQNSRPSATSDQNLTASSQDALLPIPHVCLPWVSSQIPTAQPPLPKILDPVLEKIAFTHPGIGSPTNYERMEWLGDAYLELFATILIFQTFPGLSSGRSSQLREQLVRNTTLAGYFRAYGLSSKARLPKDFGHGKGLGRGSSKDKDLLKTQSDMLEAYVAAAIISNPQDGLTNTMEWVKTLWGQTIRDQIKAVEVKEKAAIEASATGQAPPAKQVLAQTIGAKGILIQYKDLPCNKRDAKLNLPLFTVGVYLTGWGERERLLGTGTALAKAEAGHKAAEVALQNKKLMQVYVEKKRVFLEAKNAAQEAQGGQPDS